MTDTSMGLPVGVIMRVLRFRQSPGFMLLLEGGYSRARGERMQKRARPDRALRAEGFPRDHRDLAQLLTRGAG